MAALEPDLRAVQELEPRSGVSCFAGADGRYKTRMFAPGLGVPEDPATGSAAGPLAVHLVRHGWAASGRRLEIRQGEELGRPSLLIARADGEGDRFERVEVQGGVIASGAGSCCALAAGGALLLDGQLGRRERLEPLVGDRLAALHREPVGARRQPRLRALDGGKLRGQVLLSRVVEAAFVEVLGVAFARFVLLGVAFGLAFAQSGERLLDTLALSFEQFAGTLPDP